MSRGDGQRIADILDAAEELERIVNHRVDPEQVWVIAATDVPELVERLRRGPTP